MKPSGSQSDEYSFLGEEFLLWLWFHLEKHGGVHDVEDDVRIGIAIEKVIEFFDESDGVKVVVRADAPTRAPEAREALKRGMRIARAGLTLTLNDENINVVLDGQSFELRSLKCPKPEGENFEERDQAALGFLFGTADAIDRVYQAFLAHRARSGFENQVGREMREWAAASTRSKKAPRGAAAGE